MTVCIAALCEEGKACVVAADREITVGLPLNLHFDHGERKIDPVAKNVAVLSSGNALVCAELSNRLRKELGASLGEARDLQKAGETLRNLYIQTHVERAASVILAPRGITLDEFKLFGAQRLPPDIFQQIDQLFFNFTLNTEFIVAGVDGSGGHIGWVHYHGMAGAGWLEWFDRIGYQAIGSGSSHAGVLLALLNQHSRLNRAETVFNVYRAKRSAEVAPGVGPATDMALVTADGVDFLGNDIVDELKILAGQVMSDTSETVKKVQVLLGGAKEKTNVA
jgi:hypothetical protein